MGKQIKDTDYLAISARIRAMETGMLNRARVERILETRSDEEVGKILQECGYSGLDAGNPEAMDEAISAARAAIWADLADSVPDSGYIDIFRLKYDYHNVKTLLKAFAMGTEAGHVLVDMGRVPAAEVKAALESGDTAALPDTLAAAVEEAKSVMDTTRDPQLSDIVLDRWMYRDMCLVAEQTGSDFLMGYVKTQIDAVNLRAVVRTVRMGKPTEFLRSVLVEGGEIEPEAILAVAAAQGNGLTELYGATALKEAAEAGTEVLRAGTLTRFERLCDDAAEEYLSAARSVAFGEAPVVAYLAARETEYTNLRILLMGRAAGLDAGVIRSRLRASWE